MNEILSPDDGSLDVGIECKLRAEIESCVAANFGGVGARQIGAGGKVLQKIDDGITRKLVNTLKKGECE